MNGMSEPSVCIPKMLPEDLWESAADIAIGINPLNRPALEWLPRTDPEFRPTRARLAAVTGRIWHNSGVHLTVGFLDDPPADLRARILSHMNAWSKTANVQFVETDTDPEVRIARTPGDGFWSYLGTAILSIDPDEPTMNLDSFTMDTPDRELHCVVRHETGHTMGFPHEHMRGELVNRIDAKKAIKFFQETQGWTEEEVRQQVLTPLEESSLFGTIRADQNSIMCYQIPAFLTKDHQPIIGGMDIDQSDFEFVAKVYPKLVQPPV
jgi:hypothetical protein